MSKKCVMVDMVQGSDEWDSIRATMPTASRFSELVTPKKLDYSASSLKYQIELVARQLSVYVPPPPSFWMDHGTEEEPNALLCYERKNNASVDQFGFCMFEDRSAGGSPDGLIGQDGGIEVKCPKPETLISYHLNGDLPSEYRLQVQGYLWITGRSWWDFFAYHQDLPPFQIRVEPEQDVHEALEAGVAEFNSGLAKLKGIFEGQKTCFDYVCDLGEAVVI